MTIRDVATPRGAVEVTEVGHPAAPAVLLFHGVGSSRRYLLDTFAVPLVGAGWRLVAADLRGHGATPPLSDPADHAFDRQVEDVAVLADAVGAAVLGGVSLGGHAAVAAAAAGVPCRAVVACLPAWVGRAVPGEGPHAAVAAEVAAVGIAGMLSRFAADTAMPAWLRDVLLRDWPTHDLASLAAALTALDGGQAPTLQEVATVSAPIAVVGWPDDPGHPLAVARDWVAAAPRGHLATIGLHDPGRDPTAMGRAANSGLAALGVTAEG